MTQQRLWIGLMVLFLAGIVTGVAGTTLYWRYGHDHQSEQGPAAKQERLMKKLIHELSLDVAQQAAIKPIVDRTHKNLLRLRFHHQPEVERILMEGMADMKISLSPEQQKKLDGLYARLRERWDKSRDYVSATDGNAPSSGLP
jgi:Spy/CpxP family protein refolding chaperone